MMRARLARPPHARGPGEDSAVNFARPLKLLVLDDSGGTADQCLAVSELLSLSVLRVVRMEQVTATAADVLPDLAVLCFAQTDSRHLSLLNELRAKHPRLEIVFVSGRPTIDSAIGAIKAGAADFLVSPSPQELVRALRDIARRARPRRPAKQGDESASELIVPLAELEKTAILDAVRLSNGDCLLAARRLGIGKTTMYRKLAKYRREAHELNANSRSA